MPDGDSARAARRSSQIHELQAEWSAFSTVHQRLAAQDVRVKKQFEQLKRTQGKHCGVASQDRRRQRRDAAATAKRRRGAAGRNHGKAVCVRWENEGRCPAFERSGRCQFDHPPERKYAPPEEHVPLWDRRPRTAPPTLPTNDGGAEQRAGGRAPVDATAGGMGDGAPAAGAGGFTNRVCFAAAGGDDDGDTAGPIGGRAVLGHAEYSACGDEAGAAAEGAARGHGGGASGGSSSSSSSSSSSAADEAVQRLLKWKGQTRLKVAASKGVFPLKPHGFAARTKAIRGLQADAAAAAAKQRQQPSAGGAAGKGEGEVEEARPQQAGSGRPEEPGVFLAAWEGGRVDQPVLCEVLGAKQLQQRDLATRATAMALLHADEGEAPEQEEQEEGAPLVRAVFADGHLYEGEWHDARVPALVSGKPGSKVWRERRAVSWAGRCGRGAEVFGNGHAYSGDFDANVRHGQGEELLSVEARHERKGMRPAGVGRPGYIGSWARGVRSGWGREVTSDGAVVVGYFDEHGRCEEPAWFHEGGDPRLRRGSAQAVRKASQQQVAARQQRKASQDAAHAALAAQKEEAARRDDEERRAAAAARKQADAARLAAIHADPARARLLRLKEERREEGRRALEAMERRGALGRATRFRAAPFEFAGRGVGNPKVFLPATETGGVASGRMHAAAREAFAPGFSGKRQLESSVATGNRLKERARELRLRARAAEAARKKTAEAAAAAKAWAEA